MGTSSLNTWQVYLSPSLHPGFTSADADVRTLYALDPLPTEAWTHLVIVWNAGEKRLYVGGNLAIAVSGESLASDGQDVFIGADQNGGSLALPLDGKLDEIMIWDRALSDAEIAALASP